MTSTRTGRWRRISAAAAALAIGAVTAVATAPPAAADGWSASVRVDKASVADGLVLTVNGTGYTDLPNPVGGPPAAPAAGVYVGLYDTQIDNDNATSGNATNSAFVPNAMISGGSFTTTLSTEVAKLDSDSDYKILIWVAHGLPKGDALLNTQPLTLTPEQQEALFPSNGSGNGGGGETPPASSISTSVSVTSATASGGLRLSLSGSGYIDLPKASTGAPNAGVYAALRNPATMSDSQINADQSIVPAVAYISSIKDGKWTTTLTAPADKLSRNASYEVIVWVAHGNITSETLLATKGVNLSADQRAALFDGEGTPDDEKPAATIEGEDSVEPGATITFTGTGFEPGELVNGTVHSDPISLGSKIADALGTVTFTWTVPAGFEVGNHHLELVGQTSGRTATVPFTIAAPATDTTTTPTSTKKPSKTTKPSADDELVCTEESIPARAGTPTLSWGVKSSFTSYVEGGIANGTITASSGAARSGGGFTWGTGSGSLNADGTGTLTFPGSVHFTGHDGVLNTTISNLRVAITSSTNGTLTATVKSQDMSGKTTASGPVTLANLKFSSLSSTGGAATATLTGAGAAAFAGFYEAGEQLDPLTLSVSGATKATTHTVCRDADGNIVDEDGNTVTGTDTAGPGLANTGVRVGSMAGLAALLILSGGALLLQDRVRRTRAEHQ